MGRKILDFTKDSYLVSIPFIYAILLSFSLAFGFLTPDSWDYLLLSNNLSINGQCQIVNQNSYFLCGYSYLINLLSLNSDLSSLFISSKFINYILFCFCFLILFKTKINKSFLFIFFLNPITLKIFHYTWSETLMISSLISVYALTIFSINNPIISKKINFYLLLVLLIGLSSRYFFAPFVLLLFISFLIFYGYKKLKSIFLPYAITGIIFIIFLTFNFFETGSIFNTVRPINLIPINYLFIDFFRAAFVIILFFIPLIFISIFVNFFFLKNASLDKSYIFTENNRRSFNEDNILIFFGFSTLVFTFCVRLFLEFDGFNPRTIGFQLVILFTGLFNKFFHSNYLNLQHLRPLQIIFSGVILLLASHPGLYYSKLYKVNPLNAYGEIRNFQTKLSEPKNTIDIYFYPENFINAMSPSLNLYSINKRNLIFGLPPYSPRESKVDIVNKIIIASLDTGIENCRVRFDGIYSKSQLINILNKSVHSNTLYLLSELPIDENLYSKNISKALLNTYDSKNFSCKNFINYIN